MTDSLLLSSRVEKKLRCPVCESKLEYTDSKLNCTNVECENQFLIKDRIPILIDEEKSIFSINDFVSLSSTTVKIQEEKDPKRREQSKSDKEKSFKEKFFTKLFRQKSSPDIGKTKAIINRFVPSQDKNLTAKLNFKKFAQLLLSQNRNPVVLVIGGFSLGQGMEILLQHSSIELVETDVSFGPRTMLILDSHNIPFESGTFDGVLVQQVLEHVLDPYLCVEEIHRVLKHNGIVFAETPFMAPVHWGRYDFTRFTHLGHRRLFRKFKELESGATGGPGMALAWAYMYFLLGFAESRPMRMILRAFARFTSFFLKYFDYYLIQKAGVFDHALGYYFIGQKSYQPLTDKELLQNFRGLDNKDI